jgi:hypothetical protein
MPIPSEHASRQNSPDKYERVRRQNDKFGDGIHVIWGVLENGDTEVQSIHFDKNKFSPADAKQWLKEHDYKQNLEEASGDKKAMELDKLVSMVIDAWYRVFQPNGAEANERKWYEIKVFSNYEEFFVIVDMLSEGLIKYPYKFDENKSITFGEGQRVEIVFIPVGNGVTNIDYPMKAGAMLSNRNKGYLQKMHDDLVNHFGVKCQEMPTEKNTNEPETLREKAAKDIRDNGSERNHLRFIKSTDDTILVGNYMVLWGDGDHRDMEGILSPHKNADGTNGQFFTPETQFESDFTQTDTVIVDWEHGFKPDQVGPGDEALGKVLWKSAVEDDLGLWVQRGLNRRNRYIKFLEKIGVFERGDLGTSSMAVKGGVSVAYNGEIKKWQVERDSLTFTPMEPRNIKGNQLQALKSLAEEIPGIRKAYAACFGSDCDEGSSNIEQKQAIAIAKSKSLILELYSENEVLLL